MPYTYFRSIFGVFFPFFPFRRYNTHFLYIWTISLFSNMVMFFSGNFSLVNLWVPSYSLLHYILSDKLNESNFPTQIDAIQLLEIKWQSPLLFWKINKTLGLYLWLNNTNRKLVALKWRLTYTIKSDENVSSEEM